MLVNCRRLSLLSPFGRDGRAGASEGKGVGLGEGEGEESLRAVGASGCYNPSPQSSPLIQGERRGVAGGVGSHAAPTELGLILAQSYKHVASNGALHGLFTKASY